MADTYLPILRNTKDPHYRYKMPKLCAKVEGSGNGIKTVITNMSAIAKALGRPASYPTKYFGCELGAQVTMNQDYIVNGSHDVDKLINLLYGYIQKFVLCSKCKNPETTLTVIKQSIHQKCIACGHETTLPKTLHKLTTYIINHPPDSSGTGTYSAIAADTKPAKGDKSAAKDKTKDAKSKSKSKNGGSPTNTVANEENVADEDQFGDDDGFDADELTQDAYKERMRELRDGGGNGIYMNDPKESANVFFELVKSKRDQGELQDVNVQKDLVKQAENLAIKDKATLILSELLFGKDIVKDIKTHRSLLLRFCLENKKAQKYLLGGFEKLVGDVYEEELFGSIPLILKQFYDEDIIEESTLIEWSEKESKKYVSKEMSRKIHEKAAPFIKWLKEAEEESDDEDGDSKNGDDSDENKQQQPSSNDDDEDDDDIELEFSHRVSGLELNDPAAAGGLAVKTAAASVVPHNAQAESGVADADDVDIDNI